MGKRSEIETALSILAPSIPDYEFGAVVDRAMDSAGLKTASPQSAAWLSLVAYVRHNCTDYEALLEQGYDVDSARFFVLEAMNTQLTEWGVRRAIDAETE